MAVDDGTLSIPIAGATLQGDLFVPPNAAGLVIFAHGSGSSRVSPRNRSVAEYLRSRGLGTLLFDLLTLEEERVDAYSREYRFDIPFLAERLGAVTDWLARRLDAHPPFGYFGASTGAAAALVAAAEAPARVRAVVSRGGRPDLAGAALGRVSAATLLIVGGLDLDVLDLNRRAAERLRCANELVVVPGATHLFEEPGTLEAVAEHAAAWFNRHLGAQARPADASRRAGSPGPGPAPH
jgi:pimeloyl-ACP methyl ester carboxylesterase